MWYLLERVSSASVKVDGEMISSIGKGLCVLVGIHRDDTKKEMEYIAKKILSIRLFDDPQTGKRWNKSVKDLDLEVLCVSQFTLHHILKVRNIHSNCSASILGAIHIWRQHPRWRGVSEILTKSDMGEGGFDQWWRQQKSIFCCNRNKCINKNTQPLNLYLKYR